MLELRTYSYHTVQNFGRTKLWQIWNCKKIVGENFSG